MGIAMTNTLNIILWQTLAIFLLVGAAMGVTLSLLLIFKPHLAARLNRAANRWISTQHVNNLLDRSMNIEHWFYRHHRVLGVLIIIGACYILVYFGLLFDRAATLPRLSGYMHPVLLEILLDTLVLASLTGGAVALFVGLFLWLRPSMLRGIEESANKWVCTDCAARMLDAPRDQVEQLVAAHAKRVGWPLLMGSIYLFVAMFSWLV